MRRPTLVSTNTAHLVGPGKLKVINGRLAYGAPQQSPLRLNAESLRVVICYGDVTLTGNAIALLFKHKVEAVFLTPAGRDCQGRLQHSRSSSLALRLAQLQAFMQSEVCRDWAAHVVAAKIRSQLEAARHFQRHGADAGRLGRQLRLALDQTVVAENLAQLRGLEGGTSALWFRFFGSLLKSPWQFTHRNRRPPKDPVNALLSLGYTWLLVRAIAFAEAAGFELNLGGLHAFRAGRPSLACDLVEPFRVPAVDRWVVSTCNQNLLQPEHFIADEKIGFRLHRDHFARTLFSWEQWWQANHFDTTLQNLIASLARMVRSHCSQELTENENCESG